MRDVLIGAHPPAALADWRYLAVCCVAGAITFYRHGVIDRLRNPVRMFDAAGLALFAVLGTRKALEFGLGPVSAVLLGMLTGIGGGIARDVLVAQVPAVLKAELYAIAALAGAGVVVLGTAMESLSMMLLTIPVIFPAVMGLELFGLAPINPNAPVYGIAPVPLGPFFSADVALKQVGLYAQYRHLGHRPEAIGNVRRTTAWWHPLAQEQGWT